MLPGLELAYTFLAISHAPRPVIADRMLPEVYKALEKLEKYSGANKKGGGNEKEYEGDGTGYWDDYCLAKFLEGVCLRYVAYPVSVVATLNIFDEADSVMLMHRTPMRRLTQTNL